MVAGVHVGCYELFAQQNIRHIGELKGKRVGADNPELLNLIASQLGLDPAADLHWVAGADRSSKRVELFAQGKVDCGPIPDWRSACSRNTATRAGPSRC
jgi:NitT/TauT family transport system substrate-binding protein